MQKTKKRFLNYINNEDNFSQLESNVVHEELVLMKKENSDLKKKITEDAIMTEKSINRLEKEKMEQIFMLQTEIAKLKQKLREEFFLKSGKYSITSN